MAGASAVAASADQSALCDGARAGCSVKVDRTVLNSGQPLNTTVRGNPEVEVGLRFYLIEFNAAGAITGLSPQGPKQTATTSAQGRADLVFRPGAGDGDSSTPGGWGFVGFADDDNLDLTERLGQIVAFGNSAVRLLGDGYAYQKPVEAELDMYVVGNKRAGYWVEYQDDDGDWVPLAGQGPDDPINLRNATGEIGHIPYTIPAGLTEGKPYTFRLNTVLNYSGGKLLKDAGFTEWIVVPSDSPKKQGRGKNFDPSLPAGKPDKVEPVPTYSPKPSESPTPTPSSSATPSTSAKPSKKPSSRPTATRSPSVGPTSSAIAMPTSSARPTPTTTPSAGPAQSPSSTSTSAQPQPTPTPSASNTVDGAVWGNEATPPPASPTATRPTSFPVAAATAVLLLLLAAAPLGWWGWSRHRLASRALEELA